MKLTFQVAAHDPSAIVRSANPRGSAVAESSGKRRPPACGTSLRRFGSASLLLLFALLALAGTSAAQPLAITTVPPLFAGAVGMPYSQTFSVSGGVPPYSWAIVAGNAGDLVLEPSTGVLHGTPQSAGTLSFSVRVTDNAGAQDTEAYSVTVNPPTLTITTGSLLPAGSVGVNYVQVFSATGGAPPYTWSLPSGGVPGLEFAGGGGTLSGTPATPGEFSFPVRTVDSGGLSAEKIFSLRIDAAGLTITSDRELPATSLGSSYSHQMVAAGGVPPYTWSATGLPAGLTIGADTGLIEGTVNSAGLLSFTIRVVDSEMATVVDLFQMNVELPTVPTVSLAGLPQTAEPATQFNLQISLASPYIADIGGQAILSFSPDAGGGDGTIQFSTGGTTADFVIAAGETEVAAEPPLALQTGTVSGVITVSLRLQSAGLDVTPIPAPTITTQINRAAPSVNSARVIRSAGGFTIEIAGFSTAREVTQATYNFTPAAGQALQTSQVIVPTESLFGDWYQDPANNAYGSQFVLAQPFTIDGDASAVIPTTVTLTNRIGSVTMNVTE